MKIKTENVYPPIPSRNHDWCAYDDNTYGGGPGQPVGWGTTEAEAVADLLEKLEDAHRNMKVTLNDFVYVREPELGQTYQNGPYLIQVGPKSYAVSYQGQVFTWGLESITAAVDAVNAFEVQRERAKVAINAARAARRAV